jgi:hypothetical protein
VPLPRNTPTRAERVQALVVSGSPALHWLPAVKAAGS